MEKKEKIFREIKGRGDFERMTDRGFKWKLTFPISEEDKIRFGEITDEVIDLLYTKHKLSPIQCGLILEFLQKSFDDTMTNLWKNDQKEILKDDM